MISINVPTMFLQTFYILSLILISSVSCFNGTDEFTCTAKGRFIDLNDANCKTYFLCSQKKNGNWVKTTYYCPTTSNFDAELGYCTSTALCISAPTTMPPSTTTESIKTTTDSVETTTDSIETTTISFSNTNYTCEDEGKFADLTACDCGWFYQCKLFDTKFYATRLYCPKSTKFDPATSACSPDYQCPIEFVCIEEGLFLDETDWTNTQYYSCSKTEDGSFLQSHYVCPPNSLFNQEKQECIETTTTQSYPTIQPTTMSSLITEFTTSTTGFRCNKPGRFEDSNDSLCKWYFLCSGVDTFHYSCPNDLLFDPDLQECTSQYICPHSTSTESWITSFNCTKRGYFKNEADTLCKSYHFCDVLGDGIIYQYDLICPNHYIFDSNKNLCSQNVRCS